MSSPRRAAAAGALALGALWLLTVLVPGTFRSGVVAQGLLAGSASGLLALGLVLIYRTTRIVNLAYQAMGSCAAQLGATTYLHFHWPWAASIVMALVAGAVAGALTDRLLRRFEHAPRLVVTVATIGLLQVFTAVQVLVPYLIGANTLVVAFPTGLSDTSHVIGSTPFFGDDLLALTLVPLVLSGLMWFLFRTDAGIAVRGIAENSDRAVMLGVPARRLTQLVWILAGLLAAAVAITAAPRAGIPANPFVSAGGLFLPALAAAVVARLESLPIAFATAVGLGVTDWVVRDNVDKQALGTVAFLAVILVALALQRRPEGRAGADELTGSLAGAPPPLPPSVARLPELVRVRRLLIAGTVGTATLAPLAMGPSQTHRYAGYLLLGVVALSLVVLSGWSGTVSLGQYAIVGVGAVVAGNLIVKLNLDLFAALGVAAIAGGVVGLVLGAPALRIKPMYVLVSSLAFASAMDQFFLNPVNYPDWIPGDILRPVLYKRYPLGSERSTYYLCLAVLALTILVVRALGRARTGRITLAVRDNPAGAAAMALPVTRVRVTAMVIAGGIAGIAGGLTAVLERGVGGSAFPVQTSVLLFSMAVVGGLRSIGGVLAGVAVTQALLDVIRAAFPDVAGAAPLATGTLLLVILLVLPGGIDAAFARLRNRFGRWVADRRDIPFEVGAAAGSYIPVDTADDEPTRAEHPVGLVSCRNLTASYGPLQVLFGVDLEVAEGEILALLGTNGAGKSTVLKALIGRMANVGGDLTYAGQALGGRETDEIARAGIAMMPGGRGVFPTLTVTENLRLAAWQLRGDPVATERAHTEARELFPILAARADQVAGNLSGGEQQQLSLAMALMTQPRVLFIDELSLGLAPTVVTDLSNKIRQVNAAGVTVVIVEQSVKVALTLAQRAVFLEKGRVRFEGATSTLLERPDLLRSVFIGSAPSHEPGGDAPTQPGDCDRIGVSLSCEGLVKRFGGITAVHNVNLQVRAGTIVGLIGHNGAGKTTLFDLISGFQRADQGRILVGGIDITDLPPHRRVVAGLGRSFQEARLYPSLNVRDTIVAALDRHLATRSALADAVALPAALNAEAAAYERAEELIELLGLGGFADTPTADLSTGTRRVVELACVLAVDPSVILLDEPSAGVAQSETEALGALLRRVQADTGCTILIVEHDMALLASLCDELVALELGAVIATGAPDDVLADARVIASYLGAEEPDTERSGQPSDPTGVGRGSTPSRRRREPLRARS